MKKLKAIIALVLAAALVLCLFAACAKTAQDSGTAATSDSEQTPTSDEQETAEPTDTEPEDEGTPAEEELTNIIMYYFDLRMVGADYGEHVVEAVNEYIGENYGLHVDLTYFVIGEWLTKVQLAIGSGETVDVLPLEAGNGVATMYTNTMLLDITDYMEEYAPETMTLMADYIDTYRYNGRLYGVPTLRGYCTNQYIVMRKDILDELGMTELAENMSSWSEYEQIMAAVADKYTADTGLWAQANGAGKTTCMSYLWDGDNFSDVYQWDGLGDTLYQTLADTEGHVSWLYDDPRQEEKYAKVAGWAANGWIYPDAAITDTHGDELMKQKVSFSTIQASEYGIEAVKSANCGFPLVAVEYAPGWVMTSTLTSWGIGVPITSDEPEGACRMINALYTDEKLMNMLTRGIEGVDYEVVDGEVNYPDDGGYYYEADFLIGNNLLLLPLEGQGADYFDKIKEINDAAHISEYLGFVLDTTDMADYISNITSVNDQYTADLSCGNYTPELYQEYREKLTAAGAQEYVAEIQRQLDAWMAAQ